jgi:uncharacterized protein involved in exopolysaccharide biosynthesis
MDFAPGIELLRRHLRLIALVSLTAAAFAYAASFLLSPKYVSGTRVLVRVGEPRLLSPTGQNPTNQAMLLDPNLALSLAQTDSTLVQSRDVAERVVQDLHLEQLPTDQSLPAKIRSRARYMVGVAVSLFEFGFYREPTKHEAAVRQVQASLRGAPLKDSYLIQITATASNGKLAAAIANSATRALVVVSRQRAQQEADAYRNFLKQEVDTARTNVDQADQAIRQYEEAQGISSVADQQRLTAQSQSNLRQEMQDADLNLAALQAQRQSLQKSLENVNPTQSTSTTVQTGRSSTTMSGLSPNPTYTDLQTTVATLTSQIASLQAKRTALSRMLGSATTLKVPAQQAEMNKLQLRYSNTVQEYQNLLTSYDGALLNSAQGAIELTPVDEAFVPLFPSGPLRYLFVIVGLLIGIAGGGGLGYLRERRLTPERANLRSYSTAPQPSLLPQPIYGAQGRDDTPIRA